MAATLVTSFTAQSSTGTVDTLTITVPSTIPVGSKVIISGTRAVLASSVGGGTVTDSGGNTWTLHARSNRATTNDIHVWSTTVTTAITGSIVVHWESTSSRRAAVVSVWTGVGAFLAGSGLSTTELGNVNLSANGSSTTPSATLSTAAKGLVVGHSTIAGSATLTAQDTGIASTITAAGSSERGIGQQYRVTSTSAASSSAWTLSASQGWAAAVTAFEVLEDEEPEPVDATSYVIVGGIQKPITSMSVIVGGQKKTITSVSVIIGGNKFAT